MQVSSVHRVTAECLGSPESLNGESSELVNAHGAFRAGPLLLSHAKPGLTCPSWFSGGGLEHWSIMIRNSNQMGIASILTLKRTESEVLLVLPHAHASHVLLRDVGEMKC